MKIISCFVICLLLFFLSSVNSSAQSVPAKSSNPKITTYFSIVHPVVSFSEHGTSLPLKDSYIIGFPIGINFLQNKKIVFSMEFVPTVVAADHTSKMSGLLFHPGVIFKNIGGFNFLSRLAFNTNGRYGFTAVVNRPIIKRENVTYFLAMPFPVRFGNNAPATVTIGFQFGISF